MSRYEYEAHSTTQSQQDLVRAVDLIARYAIEHPDRPIICRIVLDLPEPPPDYDKPNPTG
jgi:hypothetical protein